MWEELAKLDEAPKINDIGWWTDWLRVGSELCALGRSYTNRKVIAIMIREDMEYRR